MLSLLKTKSPRQHDKPTYYHHTPSTDQRNKWATLYSQCINSSSKESDHQAAEERFWERQLRLSRWLNWITAGAGAIALIGLCFVNKSIKHADQGTIDANRAWINPFWAYIGLPLTEGSPIHIEIAYQNSGRSPAMGLTWKLVGGYFDTPIMNDGRYIVVPQNNV